MIPNSSKIVTTGAVCQEQNKQFANIWAFTESWILSKKQTFSPCYGIVTIVSPDII